MVMIFSTQDDFCNSTFFSTRSAAAEEFEEAPLHVGCMVPLAHNTRYLKKLEHDKNFLNLEK